MQLRVARHTERLNDVVAFYRDGIGLAEIGKFCWCSTSATRRRCEPSRGALGVDPIAPANPYWAEHGLTFEDPDGFRVVLVPERWDG